HVFGARCGGCPSPVHPNRQLENRHQLLRKLGDGHAACAHRCWLFHITDRFDHQHVWAYHDTPERSRWCVHASGCWPGCVARRRHLPNRPTVRVCREDDRWGTVLTASRGPCTRGTVVGDWRGLVRGPIHTSPRQHKHPTHCDQQQCDGERC